MLKIKDDVDLKKIGFDKDEEDWIYQDDVGLCCQEDRIIKCICGCKFEYEHEDIRIDTSLAYTTCPECDEKINIGTTFKHGTTRKYEV